MALVGGAVAALIYGMLEGAVPGVSANKDAWLLGFQIFAGAVTFSNIYMAWKKHIFDGKALLDILRSENFPVIVGLVSGVLAIGSVD